MLRPALWFVLAALAATTACSATRQVTTGAAHPATPPPVRDTYTAAHTRPPPTSRRPTRPATHRPRPTPTHHSTPTPARTTPPPTHRATPSPTHTTPPARMTPPHPRTLADDMADTADSSQLITVTNAGTGDAATLQAFARQNGRWQRAFGPFPVTIGAAGFSHAVSEQTVASPIGFFTLTQAFGNDPDPGTELPYHQVSYGDVWVSQPSSPYYNTMQADDADGVRGTGEKLWEVVPGYDYAVVIDYNRDPVRAGAGSAFFLHVQIPEPSAGCVTMPAAQLVALMRWLDPALHPRIAMGPLADVLRM